MGLRGGPSYFCDTSPSQKPTMWCWLEDTTPPALVARVRDNARGRPHTPHSRAVLCMGVLALRHTGLLCVCALSAVGLYHEG